MCYHNYDVWYSILFRSLLSFLTFPIINVSSICRQTFFCLFLSVFLLIETGKVGIIRWRCRFSRMIGIVVTIHLTWWSWRTLWPLCPWTSNSSFLSARCQALFWTQQQRQQQQQTLEWYTLYYTTLVLSSCALSKTFFTITTYTRKGDLQSPSACCVFFFIPFFHLLVLLLLYIEFINYH